MLVAALLTVISFHSLFAGTGVGFLLSAALVLTVRLPSPKLTTSRGIWDRTTRGLRLYLATPRLRGLLALNLAVAAAGAMVIVNTVVLVKSWLRPRRPRCGAGTRCVRRRLYGRGPRPATTARTGAGSSGDAVRRRRSGDRHAGRPDRERSRKSYAALVRPWPRLLTDPDPTGRLLPRSAHVEDRPALFAAQFALSHACWLVTYPVAGRLGAVAGLDATFLVMAVLASVSLVAATRLWPAVDPEIIPHAHTNLEAGDPHLSAAPLDAQRRHAHAFIIDERHQVWPQPACRVRAGRRA